MRARKSRKSRGRRGPRRRGGDLRSSAVDTTSRVHGQRRPTSHQRMRTQKNSRLKTGPGASPLGLFATHVRVVHTELRQDGASRSFVPLAMRASASPMRRLAPPRSRVRRPNPGISGFWAPGRGAASMACVLEGSEAPRAGARRVSASVVRRARARWRRVRAIVAVATPPTGFRRRGRAGVFPIRTGFF